MCTQKFDQSYKFHKSPIIFALYLQEEELRQGGDSKFSHLSDELHVEVSCVAPATEAHNRIAFALHELQAVLVPDPPMDEGFPPYMDDGPMMRGE